MVNNVIQYREKAIEFLKKNVKLITAEQDLILDKGLRNVAALPTRPELAPAYVNLLGVKPIVDQRLECLNLILSKVYKQSFDSYAPVDYDLDTMIREINKLPTRIPNSTPYINIFKLEDQTNLKESVNGIYKDVKDCQLNNAGLLLIQLFEGLSLKAYKDPGSNDGKPYTIGFGTIRINNQPVKLGTTITETQAIQYLKEDIKAFEVAIKKYVKVPITENMYASLVCFTYNVGIGAFSGSTFLKRLNLKDYTNAPVAMCWFNKGGNGEVLQGLVNRRNAEKELFLS